jgi:hypothetical protein
MASTTAPQLRTPGVIAQELGVPLDRVLYVLRTRAHIRPIGRAGILRLYSPGAVEAVREELRQMSRRREVVCG